jgi:hypothetical protein
VAGHHEDDCRATLALRDWLEGRRAELAERLGEELPRPAFAAKAEVAEDPETARIGSALLAGVSAERREGRARALLADLPDWHRREDKPAWTAIGPSAAIRSRRRRSTALPVALS